MSLPSRKLTRSHRRKRRSFRSPRQRNPRVIIIPWVAVLILLTLALPTILVKWLQEDVLLLMPSPTPIYELPTVEHERDPVLSIPVFLTKQQEVQHVPLELYVRGVVAAEMPAEFELEALKAQAIAARTYIVRKVVKQDFAKSPVVEAWVSDTTADQVYLTEEQLRERWGRRAYAKKISKINQAVAETRGLVITYEGEPIDATYFSTSNGFTENSEEYWSETIPYLRSVASPWDTEISPKYETVTELPVTEVMDKLGINDVPAATGSKLGLSLGEKTSGQRIKTVTINGTSFTGREVREKLGLPSAEFTWKLNGDHIIFTTYGYGHGVGMSQYGAHGMAQEDYTAEDILHHYYQQIKIVHMDTLTGWQQYAVEGESETGQFEHTL